MNQLFFKQVIISRILKDINVILNSKKSSSPTYKTKLYEIETSTFIKFTNQINKLATIIIIIKKPDFIKESFIEFDGIITYKFGKLDNQKTLPKISVNIKDFIEGYEIKLTDVLAGKSESFITSIACYNEIKLVLKLQENTRKLENYLAIDCMLREVDFKGFKYFVFDAISDFINGCILAPFKEENNGVYEIIVFNRNEDQLFHVLHYLHSHINKIIILTPNYKNILLREEAIEETAFTQSQAFVGRKSTDMYNNGRVKEFGQNLLNQIAAVSNFQTSVIDNQFCTDKNEICDKYIKFRTSLSVLEYKTDEMFDEIKNN